MKLKVSPQNLAHEMHLPQIVADLKYRRKIAEKFSAPSYSGAFDQRILRGKR